MTLPRPLQSTPTLAVVRRLLARHHQLAQDIHNVSKSLFQPGTKIQYRINYRDYFGRVIEVLGTPGRTQVRVENLVTLKQRDIHLNDVTGIVQEN